MFKWLGNLQKMRLRPTLGCRGTDDDEKKKHLRLTAMTLDHIITTMTLDTTVPFVISFK